MRLRLLALLALVVLLAGCPPWEMVGGRYTTDQYSEMNLPEGWRKFSHASESLLITRDGVMLQKIVVNRLQIDKDLPYTKKKLAKGMLPQEMAEVLIDDFRSNSTIRNQQILENMPVKIDGYPGFKLVCAFETTNGLKKQGAYYGFMEGDAFYLLRYEAPARYYFARDLPTFEKVKDSFKLLKKGAA